MNREGEVYVRAFPEWGARWPISTQGGVEPRWRRDGKELFYVSLDGTLVAVPLQTEGNFQAGAPRGLFKARVSNFGDGIWKPIYTAAGDGQRFLINTIIEDTRSPVTIVLNWPVALRRREF